MQNNKRFVKKKAIILIRTLHNGDKLVCNEDNHNDVWKIPKKVFEETYEEAK